MIVYNVKRRFFEKKEDAESYRKGEGLRPSALNIVKITGRSDLALLLNALCEPEIGSNVDAMIRADVAPGFVVDDAFVPTDKDVPAFIRESLTRITRKEEGAL